MSTSEAGDVVTRGVHRSASGRIVGAGLIGGVLAIVILGATATSLDSARVDVDRFAYGDGLIYRYVGGHLTTPPDEIDPVVSDRGTSLRYGRIGFPVLIWIAAAGRNGAMPYAQAILVVLAAAAVAAGCARLFADPDPMIGVAPFAAPGFALAVSGGFAEVVAVAFALWAIPLAARARWMPAAALLAAAILTRENAGVVVLALVVWAIATRAWRGALILASSVLPLFVWYALVAARFGHVPPFDPYLRVTTETVAPPFIALYRSITDPATTAALVLVIAHAALGVWLVTRARTSFLAMIGAVASLQLLVSGRFAWQIIGEAVRTPVFLQLLFVLALIAMRRRETFAMELPSASTEPWAPPHASDGRDRSRG